MSHRSHRLATIVFALAALLPTAASGARAELAGSWVLNPQLTAEVQPKPRRASSTSSGPRASVYVGGMPMPGTGSSLPTVAGSARDPSVLQCTTLTIEPRGETLHLNYHDVGSETLKRGNDQGLVSRWSARKLTTGYETTSRKVRQTYQVRSDGRLLVTVKLDPNNASATVFKRVFDPATPP